ncbi:MAG: undecaprenyl/decaprenyl-phosphate alpha-N-acetylglucosaminyl 1-phosphate transferase [Ignavibacteriota bacterium]|jgi:UDP-GlcNAc:undecaprenyl-phosphate GlcNAc-1-phosphate transferase|nr:undecaprenyl/decaprenyl-phosphate alpha-N-acetylglucosaminyl 1-phosphate transferase [Ignavibacteriales bacterium]MBL1124230.1 undecaprenyl/decaprenyl-phosphate alpha-N-acetylglucosaminyl 1-phosphate transferase [Ignavibacteriota bacterium]MCC7093187.1 undecaprenyl/decaprenyl-phosphate alpha-N-acetylglucosaminyl 1-phosphate transferase [Ignavibacteriaceae bacterium]MCE7855852.1 undecaprenyl/decaprenyl-phosphate alpha-N-acetylglucosaminyl 1-phosphate transferase [Ignavibacteria bacterium CHB3]
MSDSDLIILLIFLALPITYLLTNLVKIISNKIGFVNHPNPIVETHKIPIAYGGGIAIGITAIMFLIFQSTNISAALKYLLILLPIIVVGILDDIFRFKSFIKLLLQIFSSLPFVIFYIDVQFYFAITALFLILAAQNSWNLIDIMDGLLAGISTIVFISAAIILQPFADLNFYSNLSLFIGLSVLGFRFLNKYPAKIFLGETGSLLLGSLFAFTVIITFLINPITAGYVFLLGSIPLFELVFLIIVRTKKGILFYKGSPDHFALRLLEKGFEVKRINRIVLSICFFHSLIIVLSNFFLPSEYFFVCGNITLFFGITAYNYLKSLPVRKMRVDN